MALHTTSTSAPVEVVTAFAGAFAKHLEAMGKLQAETTPAEAVVKTETETETDTERPISLNHIQPTRRKQCPAKKYGSRDVNSIHNHLVESKAPTQQVYRSSDEDRVVVQRCQSKSGHAPNSRRRG